MPRSAAGTSRPSWIGSPTTSRGRTGPTTSRSAPACLTWRARRGRAEVGNFFALVGTWTVLDFAVLDVIGTGRQVAAEVRVSFAVPGGGRFTDEEIHLWTFDDAGLVTRLRHYVDTAKHIAAARGEDTTVR